MEDIYNTIKQVALDTVGATPETIVNFKSITWRIDVFFSDTDYQQRVAPRRAALETAIASALHQLHPDTFAGEKLDIGLHEMSTWLAVGGSWRFWYQ